MIRAIAEVLSAGPGGIALRVPEWPGHQPGQFVMLSLDPWGVHRDPVLGRPMAIYRGDAEGLEFRFKVVGRGTRILSTLWPRAAVGLVGPLGNGFPAAPPRSLLVGGGTGIASLYELAARAPASSVRVLLGGRTRDEVMGLADFEKLGVDLRVATEDGSAGYRGMVTDLLDPERGETVFACGPAAMMRVAAARAREAGARCWVSLETPMACGFGICLGCAVRTREGFRYVCTHGPVFDAEVLPWGEPA